MSSKRNSAAVEELRIQVDFLIGAIESILSRKEIEEYSERTGMKDQCERMIGKEIPEHGLVYGSRLAFMSMAIAQMAKNYGLGEEHLRMLIKQGFEIAEARGKVKENADYTN